MRPILLRPALSLELPTVMLAALILATLIPAALIPVTPARAQDVPQDTSKSQKAPEHKVTQSKSYVSLDPFYTTIVADHRAAGMLMVGIGLDVPNEAMHAEIDRSMPVLRDAYLRSLMAFTASSVRIDDQPDVTMIADRLQAVTDRALKRKGAKVLLGQVALRVIK
jgi:flagellar basal body-associated protein FliL